MRLVYDKKKSNYYTKTILNKPKSNKQMQYTHTPTHIHVHAHIYTPPPHTHTHTDIIVSQELLRGCNCAQNWGIIYKRVVAGPTNCDMCALIRVLTTRPKIRFLLFRSIFCFDTTELFLLDGAATVGERDWYWMGGRGDLHVWCMIWIYVA